jgi:peptidyl-prolyl cis-trans isomerase B (cyclophilin B)
MKKFIFLLCFTSLLCIHCKKESKDTVVLIETDFGKMKAKLYDSTPKHKKNFLKLVHEAYYDSLLFHRVIKNFMAQGGDPGSRHAIPGMLLGNGGPEYKIPAEIGKFHFKGALAAARQGNQTNPNKQSSGSQFYIVQGQPTTKGQLDMMTQGKNIKYTEADIKKYETLGGTPFLDGDYTVFGEIIEGLEVIDRICSIDCDNNARPLKDIRMKITVIQE